VSVVVADLVAALPRASEAGTGPGPGSVPESEKEKL
jgi:hypothetical protein